MVIWCCWVDTHTVCSWKPNESVFLIASDSWEGSWCCDCTPCRPCPCSSCCDGHPKMMERVAGQRKIWRWHRKRQGAVGIVVVRVFAFLRVSKAWERRAYHSSDALMHERRDHCHPLTRSALSTATVITESRPRHAASESQVAASPG
jgi:hypothetical protein